MSIEVHSDDRAGTSAEYQSRRSLCHSSVTSLLLGLLSVFAFLSPSLVMIPMLGIMMGAYAIAQINHRSDELAGRGFAKAGIVLSSVLLIASVVYMVVDYMTELPEGYMRISYSQLQPEDELSGVPFPATAVEFDGQKVFIKGYVFPGPQKHGVKSFLLVRDKGECCFGGDPRVTDRIQVTLADPHRLSFSSRLHKVAGVFRLEQQPAAAIDSVGDVYYYMDDCILR